MSSKTKIVVLRSKEIIYTGLFILLGILFVVLLLIMFLPGRDAQTPSESTEVSYVPGVYTTSLILKDQTVDIAIVVDESTIKNISIVNLDEAITTMYPLIEPTLDDIANQIIEKQSLNGITYLESNRYTTEILLDAIEISLEKATVTP